MGKYIYYLPIIYTFIYYIKSEKLKNIDNKIIFLKEKKNINLNNKLKLKLYQYINILLNYINFNTDILSSKYIDNKIIYFKNKYPVEYTIKQYEFKDRLLLYSLKFDNIFVIFINEILLFVLFYLKLMTKYIITQQFGNFTNNNNKPLTIKNKPLNINNKPLTIDDRKKNILEKMKKM